MGSHFQKDKFSARNLLQRVNQWNTGVVLKINHVIVTVRCGTLSTRLSVAPQSSSALYVRYSCKVVCSRFPYISMQITSFIII